MFSHRPSKRIAGFTLLELMVTITVVAILTTIAIPAYSQYVRKARRAQAKADLVEIAQLMERSYTLNRTYAGYTLPFTNSPRDNGATVGYTLSLPTLTASTYVIRATPTGGQVNDPCGSLSISQTGAKTATGSTPTGCW